MALLESGPPDPHNPARFVTPDSGLAQFLVYRSWRSICTIDPNDERTALFSFIDSDDLRADIDNYYAGTSVAAVGLVAAGQQVRRLTNAARHSFAEWKRRTSARLITSKADSVRAQHHSTCLRTTSAVGEEVSNG